MKSTTLNRLNLILKSVLLLSLCCWTSLPDDGGQNVESQDKKTKGGASLQTFTPQPVESIVVDGVSYDVESGKAALKEALSSDKDDRKLEFLRKLKGFRSKLQEGDLIPHLKSEFSKQSGADIRGAILELVMFSQDARMKDFCQLAKHDRDAKVRGFAGAWLIENGHREGLGPVTSALPVMTNEERLRFAPVLVQAVRRLEIPFVDSKGTLRPNPQTAEEALAYLKDWSEWWKRNEAEVMNKADLPTP